MSCSKPMNNTHIYYRANAGVPTSFDPLKADLWNNMPAAKMVYTTPFELSDNDQLFSLVYSKFDYNPEKKILSFTLNPNATFSNGKSITLFETILPILRLLKESPNFPLIRFIKGKDDWVKKHGYDSLPSGITLKNNQGEIEFIEDVVNPFYRLTLEIFSIAPKECFKESTYEFNCNDTQVISSGFYSLDRSSNKWLFNLRHNYAKEFPRLPQKILFEHITSDQIFNDDFKLNSNSVVISKEDLYTSNDLLRLEDKFSKYNLAQSGINGLLLNTETSFFKEEIARKLFINTLYKNLKKDINFKKNHLSRSLFPKLLEGYLDDKNLDISITDNQNFIFTNTLNWIYPEALNKDFLNILIDTCKELKIKTNFTKTKETSESYIKFFEKKSDIIYFSTGFWPFDPIGDIQMLLTPNFHKTLNFFTSRQKVRTQLTDIGYIMKKETTNKLEILNKLFSEESIFNVLKHNRFFYLYEKDESKKYVDMSVKDISGAPWKILSIKNEH